MAGPDNGDINSNSILDPGEVWVYDKTYLITADDISNGFVDNDGTATALDPMSAMLTATAHSHLLLA